MHLTSNDEQLQGDNGGIDSALSKEFGQEVRNVNTVFVHSGIGV